MTVYLKKAVFAALFISGAGTLASAQTEVKVMNGQQRQDFNNYLSVNEELLQRICSEEDASSLTQDEESSCSYFLYEGPGAAAICPGEGASSLTQNEERGLEQSEASSHDERQNEEYYNIVLRSPDWSKEEGPGWVRDGEISYGETAKGGPFSWLAYMGENPPPPPYNWETTGDRVVALVKDEIYFNLIIEIREHFIAEKARRRIEKYGLRVRVTPMSLELTGAAAAALPPQEWAKKKEALQRRIAVSTVEHGYTFFLYQEAAEAYSDLSQKALELRACHPAELWFEKAAAFQEQADTHKSFFISGQALIADLDNFTQEQEAVFKIPPWLDDY